MTDWRGLGLLAVVAHPDDESFGPGGTLALYAMRGVEVHVVCATHGELGNAPAAYMQGHPTVAEMREAELRCAASRLGLSSLQILGYRDSGMRGSPDNHHPQALAAAPVDEVATKIVHTIRQLKPQVIITSDPIGGYGHPDHIAVHRATVKAFPAAGDPALCPDGLPVHQPAKLYYHTFPRRSLRLLLRLLRLLGRDPRHYGQNHDIDLTLIAAEDYPIHARIDVRPAALAKDQASACHASQGGASSGRVSSWIFRLLGGRETFMRAQPPASPRLRERDLFEGILRP